MTYAEIAARATANAPPPRYVFPKNGSYDPMAVCLSWWTAGTALPNRRTIHRMERMQNPSRGKRLG